MSGDDPRRPGTDVAALSAGAIAVAVSMAVVPGPFDAMGAIIALSLILIILGYVWGNPRTVLQSLAVGSLLGVVAVPIVAFVAEFLLSHDMRKFITESDPVNCEAANDVWKSCKREDMHSSVYASWQVMTWFLVSALAFTVDRFNQAKPA